MAGRTCVIDVGTGRTKFGFSGSETPEFIIPSSVGQISSIAPKSGKADKVLSDMDYCIADELEANKSYIPTSPMKGGIIHDYTIYEKLLNSIVHQYLSVDPTEHNFFMTEPPLNTPENREFLAELMFETFNCRGLYIGMQAVMALMASWVGRSTTDRPTTGIVVDSGHGLTHIIPVVQCYVIGTSMRYMPIAGTEITAFTQQLIREREFDLPKECMHDVAVRVKEDHSYLCKDIRSEFVKLENDPSKVIKQYKHINPFTKKPFSFDMSYERFLGPELFFRPEIYNPEFTVPLTDLLYDSVLNCSLDCRRGLLKNVVLSGGSTVFPNLSKRIQKDVNEKVQRNTTGGNPMEVKVCSHSRQLYAVYFGSSMMSAMAEFGTVVHTKKDYAEHGPAICRHNAVFGALA